MSGEVVEKVSTDDNGNYASGIILTLQAKLLNAFFNEKKKFILSI